MVCTQCIGHCKRNERIEEMSITVKTISSTYDVDATVVVKTDEGIKLDHVQVFGLESASKRNATKAVKQYCAENDINIVSVADVQVFKVKATTKYKFECDVQALISAAEAAGITVADVSVGAEDSAEDSAE